MVVERTASRLAYSHGVCGDADGPPAVLLVLSHATGFCRQTWDPVLSDLAQCVAGPLAWLALDLRHHGDSDGAGAAELARDAVFDWSRHGSDVLEVLDHYRAGAVPGTARAVIGVGHSMGGAALVLAEAARPGAFADLLLFEPIIKDTTRLPSAPPRRFGGFDRRMLAAYARGGLRATRPGDDGIGRAPQAGGALPPGGVTLKCRREAEAAAFRGSGPGAAGMVALLKGVPSVRCRLHTAAAAAALRFT
eukprot:g1742.t1